MRSKSVSRGGRWADDDDIPRAAPGGSVAGDGGDLGGLCDASSSSRALCLCVYDGVGRKEGKDHLTENSHYSHLIRKGYIGLPLFYLQCCGYNVKITTLCIFSNVFFIFIVIDRKSVV